MKKTKKNKEIKNKYSTTKVYCFKNKIKLSATNETPQATINPEKVVPISL